MTDAITAPVKVNTGNVVHSQRIDQLVLLAKMINRIKPNTVGGKTIGNINKLSNTLTHEPLRRYNHLDIKHLKSLQ